MQSDQTWIATYQALCERCPELLGDDLSIERKTLEGYPDWLVLVHRNRHRTWSSYGVLPRVTTEPMIRDTLVRWLCLKGWSIRLTNFSLPVENVWQANRCIELCCGRECVESPDLLPCLLAAVEAELKQ